MSMRLPGNFGAPRRGGVNVNSFPYYTTIFVNPTISGASPTTYSLPAGTLLRGLSYGIGDSMLSAGALAAFRTATNLETNMVQRQQTNGDDFEIHGISIEASPDSDQYIVEQFLSNAAVEIGREGDTKRQNLGPAYLIPGAGGLYGQGHTDLIEPPQNSSFVMRGSVTAGLPAAQNFMAIPNKILWKGGSGPDSTLGLVFTLQNALSFTRTARASGTGITAWTPPTVAGSQGTFAKLLVRLHGTSKSSLSVNG